MKIFFAALFFLSAINIYGQVVVIDNDSVAVNDSFYAREGIVGIKKVNGIFVRNNRYCIGENRYGFFLSVPIDFRTNDFSAFTSALGEQNVDLMNRSFGYFTFGIGGIYNEWLAELNIGALGYDDYKNDCFAAKFNTTKYGIGFGYNLIKIKSFLITPKVSVDWNRYRLINSTKEKVSIEEYVHNRDLDIRFSQVTGFVGLKISLLPRNFKFSDSNYLALGLYGGYIFQFNEKPWVYSAHKRLINNNKIDLKNFSFGISFSWNVYIE